MLAHIWKWSSHLSMKVWAAKSQNIKQFKIIILLAYLRCLTHYIRIIGMIYRIGMIRNSMSKYSYRMR